MDMAAHNILQAETHLLGGDLNDLCEMMSQQHEIVKRQQSNKEQSDTSQFDKQNFSTNLAHQLNPSTICDIEEEQTAKNEAGVFFQLVDSHSPINFSDDEKDEEEDTKL